MSLPITVVLASGSPARLRLLQSAGIQPEVVVSTVDEDALAASLAELTTAELVQALADAKLADVVSGLDAVAEPTLVIAADSLFEIDGMVMGKPGSRAAARTRLAGLAGRCGQLLTGHALTLVVPDGILRPSRGVATTQVRFERFTDAELDAYVATDEPVSVAGGFTLDGIAAPFISGIEGDPSNVIGLSLPLVRRLATDLGVFWPDLWTQRP